ncbi:hypothetical protein L1049_006119 [Liquidambar formosana]|uniref:Uncharacterized protein n=1 Tax=Liquidambar formosana TaxID=63359 RepID=A0AAP0RFF1_LIQFO
MTTFTNTTTLLHTQSQITAPQIHDRKWKLPATRASFSGEDNLTHRRKIISTSLLATSIALGLHATPLALAEKWGTRSFLKERFFEPGLSPEDAASRIKQTAEGLHSLRYMLETMSWRYVIFYIRLKSSYLSQDLKNAMTTLPESRRKSYVKTANELVDNMAEFDYYVRTPKIYTELQYSFVEYYHWSTSSPTGPRVLSPKNQTGLQNSRPAHGQPYPTSGKWSVSIRFCFDGTELLVGPLCSGLAICSAIGFSPYPLPPRRISDQLYLCTKHKMSGTNIEDMKEQDPADSALKDQVEYELSAEDTKQLDKNDESPMPSPQQEEEIIKKKYGGIIPKKPPLISKVDHERAFFDSADWALGKQGAQKPKGPLEALRPKLQPTPHQQVRSRRSAYAPADDVEGDGANNSSAHPEDQTCILDSGNNNNTTSEDQSCRE